MSDRAVMPLSDYVSACDTIREKIGSKVIVDNKAFDKTASGEINEILTVGTLKLGESYSVKYTDLGMGKHDDGGIYEVKNINVQGKDTIGLEITLPHPAGEGYIFYLYVYQDGKNIMLYVPETIDETVYITLEEITGKIVSGELSEKVDEVYAAGQTQGERAMWDTITNYNTKIDYEKTFSESGYEYITPPYKIYPKYKRSANQTFIDAKMLKKIETKYFDFSQKSRGTDNQSAYYYTFYNCSNLEEIEDIGMQADYGYSTTFASCIKLKKIACVRSDENTLYNGEVFNFCNALEEVRFEGVIGQNGLNLRWSGKLSKASLLNIIGCLKDFRQYETVTKELTADRTQVVTTGAFVEGQEYNWSFYCGEYPGWLVDDMNTNPTAEETIITSVAEKITVNGNTYVGFKAKTTDWVGASVTYEVCVYQDGDEIKVHKDKNNENDIIKISLPTITETRTITFGTTNLNKLTDAEKAEAVEKGWTLS
jgi:hypothetical protein